MLLQVALVLFVLWLLGFSFHIGGGVIHVLLVIVVVVVLVDLLT
jgi:Family of unknown function (DUF5670)